jgi:enoyl-CoA hydratase
MDDKELLIQKSDHICTLVLNRPEKRNALTPRMLSDLKQTLDEFAQGDTVRTVIIRGVEDKAFCAGYDLGKLGASDPDQEVTDPNIFEHTMQAVLNYPYPTIAMMNGYAFGGGCDLAISCDIRIAVDNVRLGMVPSKLGVVYAASGLQRFVRAVGLANAKELFFTGRTYDAARLKEMGLVHYLIDPAELESFTYEMANEMAGNAPLALKGIKRTLNLIAESEKLPEAAIKENQKLMAEAFGSDDLKEGQSAFFEKRKPVFKGI